MNPRCCDENRSISRVINKVINEPYLTHTRLSPVGITTKGRRPDKLTGKERRGFLPAESERRRQEQEIKSAESTVSDGDGVTPGHYQHEPGSGRTEKERKK